MQLRTIGLLLLLGLIVPLGACDLGGGGGEGNEQIEGGQGGEGNEQTEEDQGGEGNERTEEDQEEED